MSRSVLTSAAAALALVLGAACGSSSNSSAHAGNVSVKRPWTFSTPAVATRAAVYMEIKNSSSSDDALTSASVSPSVAKSAELHETTASTGSTTPADLEMMNKIGSIPLPAGRTTMLEPGGYHIMLMDLVRPLEQGQKVSVTLVFRRGGTASIAAEVRNSAP